MDQTKNIKLQKKRLESAEEKRARLDKANERARAKRRMETEEQKKNEARKKECKRQLERKLRLETATRPFRRWTKKEKKSGEDGSY